MLFTVLLSNFAFAQQLSELPGYDSFRSMSSMSRSLPRGAFISQISWGEDGQSIYFKEADKFYRFDVDSKEKQEIEQDAFPKVEQNNDRRGRGRVARARQRTTEPSPDGKWTAKYADYNITLVDDEGNEIKVTDTGEEMFRFGTACWVYGEELDQQEAMWWSPDSSKLVFYEIDERHMRQYELSVNTTGLYPEIERERYPKAGDPNPYVGLMVYDLESKTTSRIEVGDSKEWYIYNIRFAPNGSLLFSKTNRHQNVLQVIAADVETGTTRTVVEEKQETWQDNAPTMRFLSDQERFIWVTESNGFQRYELRDLDGKLINPLTPEADYPCRSIVEVDEEAGFLYYTAGSAPNPINDQLHRVRLDGSDHQVLTKDDLNYSSVSIAPNHQTIVCRAESSSQPPVMIVNNAEGEQLATLAEVELPGNPGEDFQPAELFTCKAADGETDLYGMLYKPRNFDPKKKYPLVISVYGGPHSRAIYNRYSLGNPYCEFGVLIAQIDNRGTVGRGKAFESANYRKLGIVDLDDQVAGVKYLSERDYVDASRVGIYGHSYGGYMSALAILKYPGVFDVAVAGAPVTDWRNYDTIYTERYMRTPQESESAYDEGSCLTYAGQLEGKLLILHGLIDDNVHPSNTWQLVDKLQSENKRFDLMVYPRSRHGLISSSTQLRWEFLIEHLKPEVADGK